MKQVSLLVNKVVLRGLTVLWVGVRPWLGPRGVCRFSPSCSEYTRQAIAKYGIIKGGWIALRRISKCHPFHTGGYDPVP